MPSSTKVYLRPLSIKIEESSYGEIPTYKIETHVRFFYDEEMTKTSHDREFVFEGVTLGQSWVESLQDVYTLIHNAL